MNEHEDVLERLRAVGPGDQSGRDTFGRYRYQVRLAVHFWLQTLIPDGPKVVLLEHQEDLTLVYNGHARMCQAKSRDLGRSAWSLSVVSRPGGGLDSLGRAFQQTQQVPGTFELLLEGRAVSKQPTQAFFANPAQCPAETNAAVAKSLGVPPADVEPFLQRLRVRSGQPSRTSIDDKNLMLLMHLIPSCTLPIARTTYVRLLAIAEAEQEGTSSTTSEQLLELVNFDQAPHQMGLASARLLSELPGEVVLPQAWGELMARPSMSDLERKLRLAGASYNTIQKAIELRAVGDLRLRTVRAGPQSDMEYADTVVDAALWLAEAIATPYKSDAMVGDKVFAELLKAHGSLGSADPDDRFGDVTELVGVVCQVSDECRFPWRMP
ncbi:hypothetical protein [Phycicoccus mangrovi]|uniref:hypothetical protein n=1 Tax=Phycicoccus mangrovi TaxID=2840470 RepID=UPI001C001C93|nr:hypothetical protein [Phycicoccus mangrovi]